MRHGIVILPQENWPAAARRWRQAEEYGFDHAWTYDHLSWRSLADQPWHATIPTLTAAATVTDRIGLGLFVVHEMVTAHGGSVSASSSAKDGTRFEVSLPRAPEDVTQE